MPRFFLEILSQIRIPVEFDIRRLLLQVKAPLPEIAHVSIKFFVVSKVYTNENTLKCLSIGTPKAINFPFVSNEKLMFLGVPVFKHIVMRL